VIVRSMVEPRPAWPAEPSRGAPREIVVEALTYEDVVDQIDAQVDDERVMFYRVEGRG